MNVVIKLRLKESQNLVLENVNFLKIFDDRKISEKNLEGVTQILDLDSEYNFYISNHCRYLFVCYNDDKQKADNKTFINGSDILSVTFNH